MLKRSVYHEGEIAVQERAGVRQSARKVGGIVGNTLPPAAIEFLREQFFAIASYADHAGQVWASLLVGEPGFLRAASERVLAVDSLAHAGDPLGKRLRESESLLLGLLVIDLLDRKRMRANGSARQRRDGFDLHLAEVYSNCPKYIQGRLVTPETNTKNNAEPGMVQGKTLTKTQQALIEKADTLFIATHHPQRGADASHRGGMPGFVRVLDERTLVFPDYAGNRMFNTLGNLQVTPNAGLLFVDWRGATLQLTGDAHVLWEEETAALEQATGALLVGAQGRAVHFTVRAWRQIGTQNGVLREAQFVSFSPFNPV